MVTVFLPNRVPLDIDDHRPFEYSQPLATEAILVIALIRKETKCPLKSHKALLTKKIIRCVKEIEQSLHRTLCLCADTFEPYTGGLHFQPRRE
jgi:hypothetical protein